MSLFAIPSIAVAILTFIAGFLINDVAKQKAYNQAFMQVQGEITQLTIRASDAVSEVRQSKKSVQSIKKSVEIILKEANKLKEGLDKIASLQKSKKLIIKVDGPLESHLEFQGELGKRVKVLRKELNEISALLKPGLSRRHCKFMGLAENGGELICPSGSYVAGVKNLYNRNNTLHSIYCCQL